MSWTEEKVDQLTELWDAGDLSCALIGEVLGVSRNAVIGKVHRLKLAGRRPRFRPPFSKTKIPGSARKRHTIKKPNRMPRQVEPTIAPEPVAFTASTWQPLPGSIPVSLADLPAGACKWPVGDPYAPASETRFCGCPAGEGPYCREHYARSVGKGTQSEQSAVRSVLSDQRRELAEAA